MGGRASLLNKLEAAKALADRAMADLTEQRRILAVVIDSGEMDSERKKLVAIEERVEKSLKEQRRILDALDELPPLDDPLF